MLLAYYLKKQTKMTQRLSDPELSSLEPVVHSDETSLSDSTSELNTRELLREHFKPKFHIRRVTNKGAILVVVWSFLLTTIYYYTAYNATRLYSNLMFAIIQSIVGITIPFAGWLADVRIGRYKIICWSIWLMWISSLLLVATLVALQFIHSQNDSDDNQLAMTLLIPLGIGYGGFQANIIQFGVDQLHDASSNEIATFITWYSWSYISSSLALSMILQHTSSSYMLFGPLLISVNLSLALISIFSCKTVLIKEPVTHNPFKIVYNVIKYAIKNKSPRQRSAFTYCEDDLPSRIDLGKLKYGGPFTTEQVEDVKTLFRIVLVMLVGSALYGIADEEHSINSNLRSTFVSAISPSRYQYFGNFYYIIATLLIPINEIAIRPLFGCCIPRIKSYWKFILGCILHLGRYVVLLVLITSARYKVYAASPALNSTGTLPCIFHTTPRSLSSIVDYRWTVLSESLLAVSDLMVITGAIEFYCAQVPYSMKGLTAGIIYAFLGIFMTLSQVVSLPFKSPSIAWGTGTLSCGFWYLLTILIYMVLVVFIAALVLKCYKARKREDVLPSEHFFAERYYSRDS